MRGSWMVFVAAACFGLAGQAAAGEAATSAQAFERLSALVGDWEGTFDNGRRHTVNYRLSAGGTVLVETWALAPGRESITMYHRDGDELVAVHYCPQGTQPRLKLVEKSIEAPASPTRSERTLGRMDFGFDGGSSLAEKGRAHQHSFWVQVNDDGSYTRSETYVENGASAKDIAEAEAGGAVRYTRIGATTDAAKK